MTCERHYTPTAIADLQQIAASIEAERRRQHWAEMADKFRQRLGDEMPGWGESVFATGVRTGIRVALEVLDELSPPVVCDDSSE